MKNGMVTHYEDRLVLRTIDPFNRHRYFSQGKRVGKDCPLSQEERRAYVKGGVVKCLVQIQKRFPRPTLRECMMLLDAARYHEDDPRRRY